MPVFLRRAALFLHLDTVNRPSTSVIGDVSWKVGSVELLTLPVQATQSDNKSHLSSITNPVRGVFVPDEGKRASTIDHGSRFSGSFGRF